MNESPIIIFGGDCHFDDKRLKIDSNLSQFLRGAEFVVVNQESPITDVARPATDKEIHLRSSARAMTWLQDLGVKVASLANNHVADYGPEGLEETISRLRGAGITPVGAGANLTEASATAYVDLPDGHRVAFLAFTSASIGSKIADEHCHGCAELDPGAIAAAVAQAREDASHVVLLLHYGLTNFEYPTPTERLMVRALAGRDVDLVVGHHPHVVQGHEIVGSVPVFYSLGNLVFASYRKRGRLLPSGSPIGTLVAVAFVPGGVRIEEIVHTKMTEGEDHLLLGVPQSSVAPARRFATMSRNLARSSYETFFRRYSMKRLLRRLLLWTSPRRWPAVGGAQVQSLWLSLAYVIGRKQ